METAQTQTADKSCLERRVPPFQGRQFLLFDPQVSSLFNSLTLPACLVDRVRRTQRKCLARAGHSVLVAELGGTACGLRCDELQPPFCILGLPWWLRQQRICLQHRRLRFDLWVEKICWRREWLPTAVFSPGEFHGQRRSLAGYSPWGCEESDVTEHLTLCILGGGTCETGLV